MRFWDRLTNPDKPSVRFRNLTPDAPSSSTLGQRKMFSVPNEDAEVETGNLPAGMQSLATNGEDDSPGNAATPFSKEQRSNTTKLTFKSAIISSPPTLAELDATFVGNKRPGFVGVLQKNTSSVFIVFSDGSGFFFIAGTKAV